MILFPLEVQHCEAQVFVDVLDPHSYRKFEGQGVSSSRWEHSPHAFVIHYTWISFFSDF